MWCSMCWNRRKINGHKFYKSSENGMEILVKVVTIQHTAALRKQGFVFIIVFFSKVIPTHLHLRSTRALTKLFFIALDTG